MYTGFNLSLDLSKETIDKYYLVGIEQYELNKNNAETILKKFISKDGILDGSKIQENWFPQTKADIFISHSHKDEKQAIALSGWLSKSFEVNCFIDSCIWGNSINLLKIIDDNHCKNLDGKSYNYQSRNYSTSHVHMMLSTALSMMIDNTECLLFLNTPNSITSSDVVNKTKSPWIYSELALSKIVRRKEPSAHRPKEIKMYSEGGEIKKALEIEYIADTSHLIDLDLEDLNVWYKKYNSEKYPLDLLYDLYLPKRNLNLL